MLDILHLPECLQGHDIGCRSSVLDGADDAPYVHEEHSLQVPCWFREEAPRLQFGVHALQPRDLRLLQVLRQRHVLDVLHLPEWPEELALGCRSSVLDGADDAPYL